MSGVDFGRPPIVSLLTPFVRTESSNEPYPFVFSFGSSVSSKMGQLRIPFLSNDQTSVVILLVCQPALSAESARRRARAGQIDRGWSKRKLVLDLASVYLISRLNRFFELLNFKRGIQVIPRRNQARNDFIYIGGCNGWRS